MLGAGLELPFARCRRNDRADFFLASLPTIIKKSNDALTIRTTTDSPWRPEGAHPKITIQINAKESSSTFIFSHNGRRVPLELTQGSWIRARDYIQKVIKLQKQGILSA